MSDLTGTLRVLAVPGEKPEIVEVLKAAGSKNPPVVYYIRIANSQVQTGAGAEVLLPYDRADYQRRLLEWKRDDLQRQFLTVIGKLERERG